MSHVAFLTRYGYMCLTNGFIRTNFCRLEMNLFTALSLCDVNVCIRSYDTRVSLRSNWHLFWSSPPKKMLDTSGRNGIIDSHIGLLARNHVKVMWFLKGSFAANKIKWRLHTCVMSEIVQRWICKVNIQEAPAPHGLESPRIHPTLFFLLTDTYKSE